MVVKLIESASREASREAFKAWMMQFECHTDAIVIDGKTYRFTRVVLPSCYTGGTRTGDEV